MRNLCVLFICVGAALTQAAEELKSTPKPMTATYYAVRPGTLERAKEKIAKGDPEFLAALKYVTKEADKLLDDPFLTVTDKKVLAPSGDKHDYVSMAPYYWPDPKKPGGVPYMRKDGEVNPESKDITRCDDVRNLNLSRQMRMLSLAYCLTGKEVYAERAIEQLRVWFLNPETKMNPQMKYAQGVKGESEGRGTGMIDGRHLAIVADTTALLVNSKAWKADEREALEIWFTEFFQWMLTGPLGKEESNALNNHGTYYDEQIVRWALHLGKEDVARTFLENIKNKRIPKQIEPDGSQPLEASRTNGLTYSQFNLKGICSLAMMGEYVGVDLWNFKTPDGRSIRAAFDYLYPYLDVPKKPWPLKQINADKAKEPEILGELRMASSIYHDKKYEDLVQKYPAKTKSDMVLLFVP